ncbi:L-lactate MFS transporter [Clostridium thermarum]|uniref:L-lactate MFS transporter n=1 Tax=Clostridium thermarum TaxID=1716543 RepID=UPI0013D07619|nr:OFA family MFS transporter [Clostridium thermarum]
MKNDFNNRKWLVVFGAVLIQLCIGAVYTWSLFNEPLVSKFGWKRSGVVFTFSITIAVFSFFTIVGGRLLSKLKVRWVASLGAVFLGIGLMLSSTASSLTELYLYYGLIAGIGIGISYVCPLSTCIKWFPDKKGFITGIIVGAFGLGSLIFKSVAQYFITTRGVSEAFFFLGIIYMVLCLFGSQFLQVPDGSTLQTTSTSGKVIEFNTRELLHHPTFYLLWIIFLFGCVSGLKIIGLAKDIGIELVKLTPETAANTVSVIAIFNACGRLFWGALSDRIGRIRTVRYMFVITAIAMIIKTIVTLNFTVFFITTAMIALCFGGFLAVFPTITADFFGMKNLAVNYGLMFQANGMAAIIGPIVAASISFKASFILAAFLSILALIITLFIKKPVHT